MITEAEWQSAETLLASGIEQLPQQLSDTQQQCLIDYLRLLDKWNKAYNLTSITDVKDMVVKHLLDSLSVSPWVKGPRVLDVGTGAGIPGFPLAIANPDIEFILLDTNGKKTRFMTQAKTELKVANITVVKSRIEQYQPELAVDQIICRAYSSLEKFVKQVQHIKKPEQHLELLAMKGVLPEAELMDIKVMMSVEKTGVESLQVPYLEEQRHLISMSLC